MNKISVPNCKCDNRGTQINDWNGDWCWLKETPCELLTATILDTSYEWIRCENYYGVDQIECEGNKIFVNEKIDTLLAIYIYRNLLFTDSSMIRTTSTTSTTTTTTTTYGNSQIRLWKFDS